MTTLEEVRRRAESDAKRHGYFLCPDQEMLASLLEGLKANQERYGYPSCPCRLSTGTFELDRDIICPCDYRDPDVEEFGYCYCSLYCREDVIRGENPIQAIPERRPLEKQERAFTGETELQEKSEPSEEIDMSITGIRTNMKFWYCKQCGYVAFREEPPYVCPICKAKQEFFAEIVFGVNLKVQ